MSEKKHLGLGLLAALVGSLLFSTKAIFVKLSYLHEVDSVTLLLLRMIFALPFYLYMLTRLKTKEWQSLRQIKLKYWWILLLSAFLGYYLSSLLDFLGLRYIDASVERLILFIYPTLIAIISYFAFRERFTIIQMFALLTSYVGLVFVFVPHLNDMDFSASFWKGGLLILGCAFTFAFFMVINQWVIPQFGSTTFTSLSMTAACLFVIIHFLMRGTFDSIFRLEKMVYLYAFLMGTVATVIPSYIVNYAISQIGATRSAIVSIVAPISTISLAYWLLGERLFSTQIWGGVLIIFGVTLVSLEMKKRKKLKADA